MSGGASEWNETLVEERKRALKDEVEVNLERDGAGACLAWILDEIACLDGAGAPEALLNRFLYVMFALVLHERHGGLTAAQVRQLTELALAILQVQRVKPETSRLCFLYGELHLVLSQIHRRDGHMWMAAWEQQLATRLARRKVPGGKGFQSLSFGMRALRLGDADVAVAQFERALTAELPRASQEQAQVLHVNALRLAGRADAAAARVRELLAAGDVAPGMERELRWEQLCLDACASGDLTPLVVATGKGGSHRYGSFVLETYLWSLAVRATQWLDRLPTFKALTKHKELALHNHTNAAVARCVRILLDCYDTDFPIALRLQRLGEALGDLKSLVTIDKELLVWLGAARFLARNNYFEMAALCLGEYDALSRRLSKNVTSDLFGLAGDLLDKPWLTELRRSA